MRHGAAKAGLIFLEAAAVLLAVFAAGAAFLYWRLERGPISLDILKPSAEFAVERRLPANYQCDIATITLARAEKRGAYVMRLVEVSVRDTEDMEAARADAVRLSFAVGDLLKGKIGPQTINADGAAFRVVRNAAQSVELPVAPRGRKKNAFPSLDVLFDGDLLESAFDHAEMTGAQVTFLDVASGRTWTSENAHIAIGRSAEGLDAEIRADIDLNGAPAAIRANIYYTEQSEILTADIDGEKFPAGDILSMFYGEGAAIVDAPVSGKAVISFTADGDVLSSRFSARIDAGRLNLGGEPAPIEFIEWETRFNPETNRFAVDRLSFDVDGSSGELFGVVGLTFGDDVRNPQRIKFNLVSEPLTVNLPGFLAGPLPVDRAAVSGLYSIPDHLLALDTINLDFLEVGASGAFTATFAQAGGEGDESSPGIQADIRIDGALDPERLLKLWPLTAGAGARDWVADRLAAATITDIVAKMDLKPGAIGPNGEMPDEAMNISFKANSVKAYYVREMTPLTQASGGGELRGNSFYMTVDSGRVGDIAISEGEVSFPEFIPKWRPTYYRFKAAGRTDAILGVLDQDPLRLLSKINLSPSQFQGDAVARVEIMRPNKQDVAQEEYRYSGTATFENTTVSGLTGDVDLTDAEGEVDLKARSVTIQADARLAAAPLDIVWVQNFFEQDGPSRITVAGTVDSTTGDLFGVASRRFVHGPVGVKATALGDIGDFEALDLEADFSAAALTVDALGWRKPPGAPAMGKIGMTFSPDGVEVGQIDVVGQGVALKGGLAFRGDGALKAADIERFFFDGAADLALTAERDETDALSVTAVGPYFKAGPVIERMLKGAGGEDNKEGFKWGSGLAATARIDRMELRNGIEYRDATLDFWRDAKRLQALNFSALDAGGAPLRVAMAQVDDETGPSQTIEARTSQIGDLLNGVLGLTSISGGEGVMEIDLGEPGARGLTGHIEARNLIVTKAPLLARVFSAGSLDGLANLLNGEGINLTYAYGAFDLADGVLAVKDFRATGPSVGMTADGAVAMGVGGGVNFHGAVAPIYQLNSALGSAPIIGDILVGKKGEGIVALSYTVSGERADPAVLVNPLSALTPGIFRNIMQPQRRGLEGSEEGEAAEEPAEE